MPILVLMNTTTATRTERLVAFIESHGNKVISASDTEIRAQVWASYPDGRAGYEVESFPATFAAARDWLGY